ncbi:DUF4258 domain-containing protein [Candidatus Spongiihabitans sp.]|uniref:DUF4258 domain-containing protein n=1 Tax=Candidatus Spongiihabitans sp. TaxID=3101308 RepID=UPI003C7E7EC0
MKDSLISLPAIKSPAKAVAKIQQIANEDTSLIIFLDHAAMRMQERGILEKQVLQVIRNGNPTNAKWGTENERGWKCRFTKITAGVRLSVVAKLAQREEGM